MEVFNRYSSTTTTSTSNDSSSSNSSTFSDKALNNNNSSNFIKPERIKGPWSGEEDKILTKLVEKYGPKNWSLISKYIKGRSGKSCRLRWCNQLSPNVEHRPFSSTEDEAILTAHARYGNRWANIASILPGRTDNAVINHWNSTLKRRCQKGVIMEGINGNMAIGSVACMNLDNNSEPSLNVSNNKVGTFTLNNYYDECDSMTTLSSGPPGVGGQEVAKRPAEAVPAVFWDVMRAVIAREVREYVCTSFSETSMGFR